MKFVALGLGLMGVLAWPDFVRETNSHASASRGSKAYAAQQYGEAAKAYARAQELAPSARNAFNLGTAEIAAGQREQGSARMADAIRDPSLRADALYNRGNSALAAKALDHAIRDYTDALRANPNHAAAKRNLEIALKRRDSEQRAGSSGQQPNQQGQSPQQQQPREQPKQGNPQRQRDGQPDLDALLRSVQQQEQEELRRMKGQATEGKVGW